MKTSCTTKRFYHVREKKKGKEERRTEENSSILSPYTCTCTHKWNRENGEDNVEKMESDGSDFPSQRTVGA